ncbi:hypothetical protein DL96DRAFT_1682963 [Flagelloscypha sp. PMI_526]|nr:hypothetical protein DL96DRAFT_1682963 [Flagelloscypha sp. PMI_526]
MNPLLFHLSLLFAASFIGVVRGQTPTPNFPPAIPLISKTPYFHVWVSKAITANWAKLWDMDNANLLGWTGLVRVDGHTYRWMGLYNAEPAIVADMIVTPTRTSVLYDAGPVRVNVTYLTPIAVEDLAVQSIPFAYMAVDITSKDGATHNVQLYSDMSGECVSSSDDSVVQWSTQTSSNSIIQKISTVSGKQFVETKNMVDDPTFYFAMPANTPGLTWQTGEHVIPRNKFNLTGKLDSTDDTSGPRATKDRWPVLALSVDLGDIVNTSAPTVWSLGLVRNPVVQFTTPDGEVQMRNSYFWSKYSSIEDVISTVTSQYAAILAKSNAFDVDLLTKAQAYSGDYADLISTTTRLALASIEITLPATSNSKSTSSDDVKVFMRDTGSDIVRTNPVDTMFASWPFWMHVHPALGKGMLVPLFEVQRNGNGSEGAIGELGSTYPKAANDGSAKEVTYSIDNTASMILMALSYAQTSGDASLLSSEYNTLRSWADYLVSANVDKQASTDSKVFLSEGNTNLRLKQALAVKAMAEICQAAGKSDDVKYFSDTASSLISGIEMGNDNEMLYPLFWDKWLALNSTTSSLYEQHEDAMKTQIQLPTSTYGIPLSSRSQNMARADWNLLTAAFLKDSSTRDAIISKVKSYVNAPTNPWPMSAVYNTPNGNASMTGRASPALGASFALLRSNVPPKSFSFTPSPSPSSSTFTKSKPNIPSIVGGVVGGVALFSILAAVLFFYRRKEWRKQNAPFPLGHAVLEPTPFSQRLVFIPNRTGGAADGGTMVNTPTTSTGQGIKTATGTGSEAARAGYQMQMSPGSSGVSDEPPPEYRKFV